MGKELRQAFLELLGAATYISWLAQDGYPDDETVEIPITAVEHMRLAASRVNQAIIEEVDGRNGR